MYDTIAGVERFRPQIMRFGREKGTSIVQQFYHQLANLKNQKDSHRKLVLHSTGIARTQEAPFEAIYLSKLPTAYHR